MTIHSTCLLTESDFLQFCQDTKILMEFFDSVHGMCLDGMESARGMKEISFETIFGRKSKGRGETASGKGTATGDVDLRRGRNKRLSQASAGTLSGTCTSTSTSSIKVSKQQLSLDSGGSRNGGFEIEIGADIENENDGFVPSYDLERHPLWSFSVLDLMDDSWLSSLPIVLHSDSVFFALEHMCLSGTLTLPVYALLSASAASPHSHTTSNVFVAHPPTPSTPRKRNTVMTPSTPGGNNGIGGAGGVRPVTFVDSNTYCYHRRHGRHGHKTELKMVGSIDVTSVLAWIIACCPENLLSKAVKEEEIRRIKLQERNDMKFLDLSVSTSSPMSPGSIVGVGGAAVNAFRSMTVRDSIVSQSSISVGGVGAAAGLGLGHHLPQLSLSTTMTMTSMSAGSISGSVSSSGGAFGGNRNMQGPNQWQFVGENIATSSLQCLLDHDMSSSTSIGGLSLPVRKKKHTEDSILSSDQYLYDAVLMIAQGHRFVPISASTESNRLPDHMLRDMDVARLLWCQATELLGPLGGVVVGSRNSGLLKKPVCISSSTNLGSALFTLTARNVDCAVILDKKGKLGGTLRANCVKELWWAWKQQTSSSVSSLETASSSQMSVSSLHSHHHHHHHHLSQDPVITSHVDRDVGFRSALQQQYSIGHYVVPKDCSSQVFSMFSCLLNPLHACGSLDIHVTEFDHCINRASMNNDEESNSDSDSSSSSSSSEEEKEFSKKQIRDRNRNLLKSAEKKNEDLELKSDMPMR